MKSLFIILSLTCFLASALPLSAQPDWTINPAEWQNNMSIIAVTSNHCEQSFNTGDIVALFDNADNIRGVQHISSNGFIFLTAFSNESGETLNIKVYDVDVDLVIPIPNVTVTFVSDALIGTPLDPLIIAYDLDPSIGFAGPDQVVNGNTTMLEAIGIGQWQIISGNGGVIADEFNSVSSFEGLSNMTYALRWTISGGLLCSGMSDELSIEFIGSCEDDVGNACDDDDPCTSNDVIQSSCNCAGNPPGDADNDGTNDCLDSCPTDPTKIEEGICGCGNLDVDEDMNGICDALEGGCEILNEESFETGQGIWNSPGVDAERVLSPNSPNGSFSMRIRDNSFEESATFSDVMDLSKIDFFEVVFSFKSIGFTNPQSFLFEFSNDNGETYSQIEEWISGPDFLDGNLYRDSVSIDKSLLSATSILQFRCIGNINADEIYLDDITLRTCTSSCLDFRILNDNSSGSSEQANIGIESNQIIETGNNIHHKAGSYITMNELFEVKLGGSYHALIEACEGFSF